MSESEAPLSGEERLLVAALYARLSLSQNRTVPGRLAVEAPCCADLNRCSPETWSHNEIPVTKLSDGSGTC